MITQKPPRLISPQPNAIYFLIPGIEPSDQEIPLEAEASNRESELAWFVNGRFLEKTPSHQRAWFLPEPGPHEIRVVDSSGQFDRVFINIIRAN